jgi:hypothetical protein
LLLNVALEADADQADADAAAAAAAAAAAPPLLSVVCLVEVRGEREESTTLFPYRPSSFCHGRVVMTGLKRALDESSHAGDDGSPQAQAQTQALDQPAATKTSPAASSSASSFRNVSACNRSVSSQDRVASHAKRDLFTYTKV